jgi:hypothetical protein
MLLFQAPYQSDALSSFVDACEALDSTGYSAESARSLLSNRLKQDPRGGSRRWPRLVTHCRASDSHSQSRTGLFRITVDSKETTNGMNRALTTAQAKPIVRQYR